MNRLLSMVAAAFMCTYVDIAAVHDLDREWWQWTIRKAYLMEVCVVKRDR